MPQHLYGDRQAATLRLAHHEMHMLGHDHIANNEESMTAPHALIEDVILSEAKNLAMLYPSRNRWRRRSSREL